MGAVVTTEESATAAKALDVFGAVDLCGVVLHKVTERGCIDWILIELNSGRGGWVVTPNLEIVRRCAKSAEERDLVARADLRVADGMPLIWASRVRGEALPARVAGSSLILTLSEAAAARGRSIFLLGGEPGSAEEAAQELAKRNKELSVVGTYCPPMGFERDAEEMARIREALVDANPDIVFVGLGFPKQERLIAEVRELLPQAWWLGVGVSFSFVSGHVQRAPGWMQRCGVEWLHRLSQEPGRLARRYLIDGIPFGMRLMIGSAACRLRGKRQGAVR